MTYEKPDLSQVIVTIDDMRQAGYCAAGVRTWFKAHNLEFRDLLRNGIPADKLLSKNDACAEHIVSAKLERERPNE